MNEVRGGKSYLFFKVDSYNFVVSLRFFLLAVTLSLIHNYFKSALFEHFQIKVYVILVILNKLNDCFMNVVIWENMPIGKELSSRSLTLCRFMYNC